MIVVTVELWPGGNKKESKLLGRMDIWNKLTHPDRSTRGNYGVRTYRRGTEVVQRIGDVDNYPKLAYSVWELVARALWSCYFGQRDRVSKGRECPAQEGNSESR